MDARADEDRGSGNRSQHVLAAAHHAHQHAGAIAHHYAAAVRLNADRQSVVDHSATLRPRPDRAGYLSTGDLPLRLRFVAQYLYGDRVAEVS